MIQQRNINGSIIEIYINGGGDFITEAFPTNFHTFRSSRMLNNPADIDKYKEVTAAERAQLEAQDAKWVRPPQAFIDLWNKACIYVGYYRREFIAGGYNEETGFFELNGITDITYEEALAIYNFRFPPIYPNDSVIATRFTWSAHCRTIFPLFGSLVENLGAYFYGLFSDFGVPLTLAVGSFADNGLDVRNMDNAFVNCRTLVEVKGKIDVSRCTKFNNVFLVAPEIREFDFYGLKSSLVLKDNQKISHNTFELLISQALNESQITITVHAVVYAALNGNATDYPFNGGSREQWTQLLQEAAEKQILFATA